MKRRPLRTLLRAERRIMAVLRGGGPKDRGHRFRQSLSAEQRQELRARLMLRGWSQKPGGGWHVRGPFRIRGVDPELREYQEPQQRAPAFALMFGWPVKLPRECAAIRDSWLAAKAALSRMKPHAKNWLRSRWRWLRYAEPLPPKREQTKTEQIVGWSVAALAAVILQVILPREFALWGGLAIGAVQFDMTNCGAADGSSSADPRRQGGLKINKNYARMTIMTGMLCALWFSKDPATGIDRGYSKEQIITAAYNDPTYGAIANGDTAIFLSKSLTSGGYDITLTPVAANPTIHPFRESGSLDANYFDVEAYGASTAATWAAQQAAFDAAAVNGGTVWYNRATQYQIEKPLWMKKGCKVLGQGLGQNLGTGASKIAPTYAYGPALLIEDAAATIPGLGTALLTGTGNSWTPDRTNNNKWFNLRDAKTCDLGGLAQFCSRATVKLTSAADGMIIGSSGNWFAADGNPNAFQLRINGGKYLFILNLSGGQKSISDPGVPVTGSNVEVAGTYDGTTVRLLVGGVVVASTAGSGTVVQDPAEDVVAGMSFLRTPERQLFNGGIDGAMDGVEVADIARFTGAYTPGTTKPVADSHTRALMNFDSQIGPFTRVYTNSGDLWAWHRQGGNPQINGVNGWEVGGLWFAGPASSGAGGIFVGPNSNTGYAHDLDFENCRYTIYSVIRDSYSWTIARISINNAGGSGCRYGITNGGNAGHLDMTNLQTTGCLVSIFTQGTTTYRNVLIEVNSESAFAVITVNPQSNNAVATFYDLGVSTEIGVGSLYRATIGVGVGVGGDVGGIALVGGSIENATGLPFMLTESGVNLIEVLGTHFKVLGAPTAILKLISGTSLTRPAFFDGRCVQTGTFTPWSDTAGAAIVGEIGPKTVTFGASPVFDCSAGDAFYLSTVLTANLTGLSFSNITPDQEIDLLLIQNGAGGFTINQPANVHGDFTVDTTASHFTRFKLKADLSSASAPALQVVSKATGA